MDFEQLKQICKPSLTQVALYSLISLVAFITINFGAISDKIKDQAHFNDPTVRVAFEAKMAELNQIPALSVVTIVIFWSTIGLVIYTVFWLGITILTQARNEIVVEADFANRGSLRHRIKIPLIQLGLFFALLVVAIISLSATFPTWVRLFGEFLLAVPGEWLKGLLSLGLAFLGAIINLYIMRTIMKIMLEVDHLIEN